MRRAGKEELGGDYIDARDAEARLDYLREEKSDLESDVGEAEEAIADAEWDVAVLENGNGPDPDGMDVLRDSVTERVVALEQAKAALKDWELDYGGEYGALGSEESIIRSASGNGETLIEESKFADYVEEFCQDCGYIPKDIPWWISIDWDATAENVKQDYSTVELHCGTYYVRNC